MSEVEGGSKPGFDINAEARVHGSDLNLPQQDEESDTAYRHRIAGVLRGKGRIIEAHEVISGRRYDDPEQGEGGPMTGIIGAIAQELQDRRYSPYDPERQVGDDLAAGLLVTHEQDQAGHFIAEIFEALGPEAGVDFIQAFHKDPRP